MAAIIKHLVRPEDLNGANTLFGGKLLAWIDEAAAISAIERIGSGRIVTVGMSHVNFKQPVFSREIVSIRSDLIAVGTTSITYRVVVTVVMKRKKRLVITVDSITFVYMDEGGHPTPHGLKKFSEKKYSDR